ncbi:MAG TPA: Mur ligase family protein [Longimicrobiales bacterium]|nr:Mur ligase family protein [Longimicrobiales bacterium]
MADSDREAAPSPPAGPPPGPPPDTYSDLVRELFPRLTAGIRWGLDRVERLLRDVGDPQLGFPTIHVGGTNGKGSVSALLASVLSAAGLRVGLYTSPHLCSFRERIRIDGEPLDEPALLAAARALWPGIEREAPSFFESTTAVAFLALAEAAVDVAVVEVGLGGRLDATNVVRPEVAVLTNVALDHAQYLGDTREAIAREKAGIIKAATPVVTAETDPAIRAILRERAAGLGAAFHSVLIEPSWQVRTGPWGTSLRLPTAQWGTLELSTPLPGVHQAANAALAVRALELLRPGLRPDAEAIVRGVAAVRWPGRLQREQVDGRTWLFDVAHNVAGIEALVAALPWLELPRPVVALVGILGDKDWGGMLPRLFAAVDGAVLTEPPTAPAGRRWDPVAALSASRPSGGAEIVPDFTAALGRARERAGEGTVLVTGSFHTVGDALAALGIPPCDVDPPLPPSAGPV